MELRQQLQQYTIEKLYDDTYAIKDSGFERAEVFMYLLVGSEKALLIDAGYGFIDLKNVISTVTDKEVVCVLTHGHHDHIMGSYRFEKTYIHSKDIKLFKFNTASLSLKFIAAKASRREFRENREFSSVVREWAHKKYKVPNPIDGIQYIDLGDRRISWYLLPGHTQGSIALIDEKNKTVFDGDACHKGLWLYLKESTGLKSYIGELEKYHEFLLENGIEKRYIGHSCEAYDISDIDKLLACCKTAYNNPDLGTDFRNPYTKAKILKSDGSSVVYSEKNRDK